MKDTPLSNPLGQPIRLLPIFRERVWGKETLSPYFIDAPANKRIGEVWFTFAENLTSAGASLKDLLIAHPEILGTGSNPDYPGICPLLVKLLFTTERLSVQVHPDDQYAAKHHACLGKTEAWYIMDSQPPGEVAVGFREILTPERLKESALSGEIETLLDWRKVSKGDVVFTPAGTVHAIGAGLTVCEIQENSDITYRLYDYGRPRDLHLDHGTIVSHLGPHLHDPKAKVLSSERTQLLACDYFHIEKVIPQSPMSFGGEPYYLVLICLEGNGTLNGEPCKAGEAFLVPAGGPKALLDAPGSEWILTYTAGMV